MPVLHAQLADAVDLVVQKSRMFWDYLQDIDLNSRALTSLTCASYIVLFFCGVSQKRRLAVAVASLLGDTQGHAIVTSC